jgi:hypothetical protein
METEPISALDIPEDEDFEEILDEEQIEVMGGTGTELVLWPWDLK